MAKKPVKKTAKKAAKKVIPSKPRKLAEKAGKKKAKESQIIITFKEEKDGTTVCVNCTNTSTKMMAMAHDALGETVMQEMAGVLARDKG